MSTIETGGPAFPTAVQEAGGTGVVLGMTLRDYFAAKAMQGFAADSDTAWGDGVNGVARTAYEWADAMLRARGA